MRDVDDDAARLYSEHGIRFDLAEDHPFARDEIVRWGRAAELGRVFLAVEPAGFPIGFAALDLIDGEPYLDQLAVRMASMRRGVGGALLQKAAEWAHELGHSALWLTTYSHLPFNRPFYERHGYVVMPEEACGAGIRHHLEQQRQSLPAPSLRVAMRRSL